MHPHVKNTGLIPARPHHHDGFTLVEVLVSAFIVAITVLGVVAMQLNALRTTQQSAFHTTALRLATDMAEAMRALPVGFTLDDASNPYLAVSYQAPASGSGEPTSLCYGREANCSPGELARVHIHEWKNQIKAALPGGRASICRDSGSWSSSAASYVWDCDNASAASIVIKIGWQEKQPDGSFVQSVQKEAPPALVLTVGPARK